jgi:hypothetical protein
MDEFLSSGEGRRHLLCWVPEKEVQWSRLALSKGPNKVGVSPPHLRIETDPVQNVVFPSIQKSGQWTRSRNPVIGSVIYHCQNPSDSKWKQCFMITKTGSILGRTHTALW